MESRLPGRVRPLAALAVVAAAAVLAFAHSASSGAPSTHCHVTDGVFTNCPDGSSEWSARRAARTTSRADRSAPRTRAGSSGQREGNGPGRTYTLVSRGSDAAGTTAECSAKVVVPHDQGKG
jgi:hypothetical protein